MQRKVKAKIKQYKAVVIQPLYVHLRLIDFPVNYIHVIGSIHQLVNVVLKHFAHGVGEVHAYCSVVILQ